MAAWSASWPDPEENDEQRRQGARVYRGIAARDADLATRHLHPERYVEHDPQAGDRVEGVRRYVAALAPDDRLTVVRVLEDGDQVMIQADGRVRGDGTFFDLFRLENGLIVEHWGFATPAGPPSRSGHTQVDGQAEPAQIAETAANRAFAREYHETFHIGGRHDLADRYFDAGHRHPADAQRLR